MNNTTYNTPANAEQLKIYDAFLVADGSEGVGSDSEDFAEIMGIGEDGKTAATVDDLFRDIEWRWEQRRNERAEMKDSGEWTKALEKDFGAFKKRMNATINAIRNA